MITAYRFNYEKLPPHLKTSTFDQERKAIFQELIPFIGEDQINLNKFKSIYGLKIEEREQLTQILLHKILHCKQKTKFQLQLMMTQVTQLVQNKQKYFSKQFHVDYNQLHSYMLNEFLNNQNQSIVSQTISTQLFIHFCQFVKSLRYFFDESAIQFGFTKFQEQIGMTDKQLAWSYLIMFVPFRSNIDKSKYNHIIEYLLDSQLFLGGEKDNCRFRFILNYMRVYPDQKIPGLMIQLMRNLHGCLRLDSNANEKNEKLINMLVPDETLLVDSMFKIIPQILIEQMGSSKSPSYPQYQVTMKRFFSLIDSILSVYNQQTWDDAIFKLIKLLLVNLIQKYRRDQLILQIQEINVSKKYDTELSQMLVDELTEQFNNLEIQDYLDEEKYNLELLSINPEQGYSQLLQKYPVVNQPTINLQNLNKKIRIQNQEYLDSLKDTLIDAKAKDDFIAQILKLLEKILFMEDPGFSIPKTALYLAYFEPSTIQFFIDRIKLAMQHMNDLSFATIKSVLIFLIQPILHGKNNYGLKDLIPFMEITYQLFEVQGITENIDSLEFYCKIFMSIPAYSPEEFFQKFPDSQNKELCEFLSDFLYQILRLVIKNFNLIKYKDVDSNSILINLSNIFWPMVCNSSSQIIKEIINDLLLHIENDLEISQIHQLGDLLDCIVFSHCDLILRQIIELVSERLLKPREPTNQDFHFLAEKSPYFDEIKKYQPSVANKATKKLWLTLLEKALTQGGSKVQEFEKEVHIIIMNYFNEEEDGIFDKTCDIIHTMIMTTLNIRPKNLQGQQGEFMRQDFNVKSAQPSVQDLSIDWYYPQQKDWDFVIKWLQLFMESSKQYFLDNFGPITRYELPQQFTSLIDQVVFGTPPLDPKLKKTCYRIWFIIFATFSGASLFIPFDSPEFDLDETISKPASKLHKIQLDYMHHFIPNYFHQVRKQYTEFVIDCMAFSIEKGIAHDKEINEMLIYMANEVTGCSLLNCEIQLSRDFLEGGRYLNSSSQHKLYFDTRIQLIIDANTYLYQRHLFLMHLQSVSQSYSEIHTYATILYFTNNHDFSNYLNFYLSPSQSMKDFLNFKLRNRYLEYLLKVLDYNDPESRLCQIKQSNQKSKVYKQLQDLLRWFYQPISEQLELSTQKLLNKFISIINYIDNNNCRQLIVDGVIQTFALNYDENSTQEGCRMEMINESINALHSNLSWKCKVIHSISLLNNVNLVFDKLDENQLRKIIQGYKQLAIIDHTQLNQLGRSALFYFLKKAKKMIFHKHSIEPDKENELPLDEFLQWRFITKSQKESVDQSFDKLNKSSDIFENDRLYRLKDSDLFLMNYNRMLEISIVNGDNLLIQILREELMDLDYLIRFCEKVMTDKDVQTQGEFDITDVEQCNQEVQFMSTKGITKYVQVFFSYIYGKDKKKHSPFSTTQSFFLSDFYLRFFKKMFQVCGIKLFNLSKSIIEGYITETENREKQVRENQLKYLKESMQLVFGWFIQVFDTGLNLYFLKNQFDLTSYHIGNIL